MSRWFSEKQEERRADVLTVVGVPAWLLLRWRMRSAAVRREPLVALPVEGAPPAAPG